jgi:hypothetical protein
MTPPMRMNSPSSGAEKTTRCPAPPPDGALH